ncbi:hypothetical protein F8M41_015357 [Gigaspora margarita]|uniref:Uncharacterized protein n=1 Tax=Gigaspora margarita TaxID=4874 RepID=A0A8H4B3A9_GIGMA|nr:hypothetical protein F8M41_015357 [Gigaspora margarita]
MNLFGFVSNDKNRLIGTKSPSSVTFMPGMVISSNDQTRHYQDNSELEVGGNLIQFTKLLKRTRSKIQNDA